MHRKSPHTYKRGRIDKFAHAFAPPHAGNFSSVNYNPINFAYRLYQPPPQYRDQTVHRLRPGFFDAPPPRGRRVAYDRGDTPYDPKSRFVHARCVFVRPAPCTMRDCEEIPWVKTGRHLMRSHVCRYNMISLESPRLSTSEAKSPTYVSYSPPVRLSTFSRIHAGAPIFCVLAKDRLNAWTKRYILTFPDEPGEMPTQLGHMLSKTVV